MTIGDTSMMSKERQQQFINSSLIHIVAVSGGNIAIVLMIF
ncbi:ComEC/Rec2 family competence protein [Patescibacteria group bacterium]|nr:ComEC/Rec2 family competence protein [Patescibacteria group bacterium]